MENLPFSSDTVVAEGLAFTPMVTPAIGSLAAFTTRPLIVRFCARDECEKKESRKNNNVKDLK
jgi:hypothetical protein